MTESTKVAECSLPTILILDDEADIRQMISLCLKKGGFQFFLAESAAEAYNLLNTNRFDAILSDIKMPGEDGVTFLGRVHDSWPDIPVILMTGQPQLQMAINAIKNGAFDFIQKPFDIEHLLKIVGRALKYHNLKIMEKQYYADLEIAVAEKTAQLKESMIELDYARSAIQKAVSDKTAFMSTISHEMRTPMNGVIGSLELLMDEGLSGVAAEYTVMARQSADKMMELIEQLLSFNSTLTSANDSSCRNLIDLPNLLKSIISRQQPLFNNKKIILSLLMSPNLPQKIWTDREKLSRLLEILLGNALKFTKSGSVILEISTSYSYNQDDQLYITVTDSGIGIPEGMLERIFEPFVQGDSSYSRSYEGAGLGLAIAKQNATLLNGNIWAEHIPEGGSRFVVTLELKTP